MSASDLGNAVVRLLLNLGKLGFFLLPAVAGKRERGEKTAPLPNCDPRRLNRSFIEASVIRGEARTNLWARADAPGLVRGFSRA